MDFTALCNLSPDKRKALSKTLLIMRFTTLILLSACLQVCAKGYSQITLSETNVPLQKVFKEIQKQSGYDFLCSAELLKQAGNVTVKVNNVTLKQAVEECLKGKGLDYDVQEKTVIVKRKKPTDLELNDNSVSPPPIDIHGHVTDSLGNPLVGASVTVKGSRKGTSTDARGDFVLHGVNEKDVLVISFTGYISKNLKLDEKNSYLISLVHSDSPLDQVQIIAYGTTTKRLSTGDQTSVSGEEIAKQPVTNSIFALEGRVPGLNIIQSTGNPGAGYGVQIRGQNSIGSSTAPLYIVDGVPFTSNFTPTLGAYVNINYDLLNPLNYINPLDIESIDVLKDADATAIYGSRGANGVVLITTKRGKSGKTKIDFSAYTGGQTVGHFVKLLNTSQYLTMRREAYANDGLTPDAGSAPDLLIWDTTKNTNWQKQLIGGTAQTSNVQLSISGGNKNTQFLFSGDYRVDGTVLPGDFSDKRGSVNLSLNNVSDDQKFRFNVNVNYVSDNNNFTGSDITASAAVLPPDNPAFLDSSGNLLWAPGVNSNPYAFLKSKYLYQGNNLIGSGSVHYFILPDLDLFANLGYTRTTFQEIATSPVSSYNPAYGITTGSSSFANNSNQSWIVEPQLNWKKTVGPGKLNVLIGSTFQESIQQGTTILGTGYSNDALLLDINSAAQLYPQGSIYSQYRYSALFGRINYNYLDKFIINLTGRRDGSSRFAPGKQFANFGAVGGAWIFSNESFVKNNLSFLSFGKIRGSYGLTGSDGIGNYGYIQSWSGTGFAFQGGSTIYPINLSSTTFEWEEDRKLEFGINLGFLKDRVLIEASWYENRSGNELVGITLPPSVGYTSVSANFPAVVQNTGLEMILNTTNVKSNSFTWMSSLNISFPRNKLVAYPNLDNSPYANIYTVGKSLSTLKTLHYVNVNPETGVYTYQDIDGSGTGLDVPGDLQASKQIAQDYYGGFDNSFSFHGFQLDILFQFVKQTGLNPVFNQYLLAPPGAQLNEPVEILQRWQKPGDNVAIQKFTTGNGADASAANAWNVGAYYGDNRIVDASFIRLKNLALSYHLSSQVVQKIGLADVRIFVQCQNLFTITSYKGIDPESQNPGLLPPLRVITGGFQLTF
jgi:TonB-dependent starch-binding outer membrane protein SusC